MIHFLIEESDLAPSPKGLPVAVEKCSFEWKGQRLNSCSYDLDRAV